MIPHYDRPHWHQCNPWAADVFYIPIECAAELCLSSRTWTAAEILSHWRASGDRLDAYILPQPSGHHCIGVRYGADGPDYISPGADYARLRPWLARHAWSHVFRFQDMSGDSFIATPTDAAKRLGLDLSALMPECESVLDGSAGRIADIAAQPGLWVTPWRST